MNTQMNLECMTQSETSQIQDKYYVIPLTWNLKESNQRTGEWNGDCQGWEAGGQEDVGQGVQSFRSARCLSSGDLMYSMALTINNTDWYT